MIDLKTAAQTLGQKGGQKTLKKYGRGYFKFIRTKSSGRKKKSSGDKLLDKRSP